MINLIIRILRVTFNNSNSTVRTVVITIHEIEEEKKGSNPEPEPKQRISVFLNQNQLNSLSPAQPMRITQLSVTKLQSSNLLFQIHTHGASASALCNVMTVGNALELECWRIKLTVMT